MTFAPTASEYAETVYWSKPGMIFGIGIGIGIGFYTRHKFSTPMQTPDLDVHGAFDSKA